MLDGFHEMDEHFRTAPFAKNLPVLMGLLSVWNNDFLGAETVAVLPYEQYLKRFPAYLQQLTMESNGKHVTLDGKKVNYQTGPVYWGEPGHQRPALVLSIDPSGHAAHPVRLHRFRPRADPAGPPPRYPHGECICPGRGAGVRQDARGSQGRGHGACARAAPRIRGQPPVEYHPRPAAHAGGARQARCAVRAHRLHPGDDLERQFIRPVGRRTGQGARPAHHPRTRKQNARPGSSTTVQPTT